MPYLIQDNDEFRLTLFCRYVDQESNCDIRLRATVPAVAGAVTDQQAVDALSNVWADFFRIGMPPGARYEGATLRRLTGLGPRPVTKFSTTGAVAGAGTAPGLPTQVCALVSMYTELSGKQYRGRMYYPFLESAAQDAASGELTAAFIGSPLGDIATEVKNNRVINGTAPNTITVKYGLHPVGGTFQQYQATIQHGIFATQRRRGDYGQKNRTPFQ